ncbi:hypothetical protein O181_002520 [Austropuccinia psidii MF-1]|uniref:Uncharacterized protein n=1 Tax=Austropuccinia psidii MF-1 TaxID=1389203 RepID=A0A9Q3GCY0_9BASI|nr:hypothetical protein [Austropuccinia psidii MF-1]
MTIVHKSGNINKNADGISRWALEKTPENPEWVPREENHIEGICVTDIGTELLNKAKESYMMKNSCHILCELSIKHFKDSFLFAKIDEIWKKAYDEGIFHLLDGLLYHRTKHSGVMTLEDIFLISTILHGFHDSVVSGHL